MSILDRYIGGVILQYALVAMLALVGLFAFVTFLDQLGDVGGGYGVTDALGYVALTIPRIVYELFPMAALLGAIIGLSVLAADSELIVMRAGGVSVKQITLSALKTGAVFVVAAMLIGEAVAPASEARATQRRAEALQKNIEQEADSGLWMRDGGTFINALEVLPDLTLLAVKIFEFDADKNLREITTAAAGEFNGDHWLLRDVKNTRINDGDLAVARRDTDQWRSTLTPQILSVFLVEPDQLSLLQLRDYISHLRDNRQQTDPYRLAFWNKLMLPLSVAVMVALAIPFVFVNIRTGNLGKSLFTGIMLGIGFYIANKTFGFLTLAYALPPALGATAPMLAFLSLALVMMRRVE